MAQIDEDITIDCSAQRRKRMAKPKAAPPPVAQGRRAPIALTARPAPPLDEWDGHCRPAEIGSAAQLQADLVNKLNEALAFATRAPLPLETPSWRWTKVSLLCRRCVSLADVLEEKIGNGK